MEVDDVPELPPSLRIDESLKQPPPPLRRIGESQGSSENGAKDTSAAKPGNDKQRVDKEKKDGRTKKRELVKLDAEKLLGPSGLPRLRHLSSKLTFKGKGHETENLRKLIAFYQIWAHNLFPKLKFASFIERTEKVCRERRMKIFLEAVLQEERRRKTGITDDQMDSNDTTMMEGDGDDHLGLFTSDSQPGGLPQTPNMDHGNTGIHISGSQPLSPSTLAAISANKERALAKLAEKRRQRELQEQREEEERMIAEAENAPLFAEDEDIF
ncbi:uncharacterized protein SPPG_07230 [Spizellomyces punctatus DAOM BR117]|uniref:Chromosome segregation in meiosis protein n=1 Tax=Spizellomyces punctatus (strain DAOM BR117) TaxID=645134 RepID=A0A0L0H8K1_SPIPD|nr:uncharacterized protein SPPG_07230 [Spizellomyces punctatus DAOM BR117]KNC97301.1 hypothetical protein SPPG_07230 [Spizellomyces punctatus DAOM BR117]|eukprot:XP_016605341.1 hypothetical protein SPPG_07230 [Spizellomyces punctatus DAOM BR117]